MELLNYLAALLVWLVKNKKYLQLLKFVVEYSISREVSMEKEILNIAISGEEKNKNEIIYNNIVEAMETLKMSKDDQIEYLKMKVSNMEHQYHNNVVILIVLVVSFMLMCLGLYLVATNEFLLGVVLTFIGFGLSIIKLLTTIRKNNTIRNKKYIELESLRDSLSSILK